MPYGGIGVIVFIAENKGFIPIIMAPELLKKKKSQYTIMMASDFLKISPLNLTIKFLYKGGGSQLLKI